VTAAEHVVSGQPAPRAPRAEADTCPACGETPCHSLGGCAEYLAQTWAPSPGLSLPAVTIRAQQTGGGR
jgi:hypothetical protein